MIRGISYKVPNKWGKLFEQITKYIEVEKYYWFNIESQNQVFNEQRSDGEFLFDVDYYGGSEFKEKIGSSNYYAVFVKLQAYLSNKTLAEIDSYNEFLKSNCEIILFVVDNTFVDIYVKDRTIIEKLKLSAEEHGFTDIDYITEKNDKMETFKAI